MSDAKPIPETGEKEVRFRQLRSTIRRLFENRSAVVALFILLVVIIMCACAPLICQYSYTAMDYGAINALPSAKHWFGCDQLGRDIFTRILYGGRYSISLGIVTAIVGMIIGLVLGVAIGYAGGVVDMIGMRLVDIWAAIPGMLLCIVISSALGTGFVNTIFALCVGTVPSGIRMSRAMCLRERNMEYLEAATSINVSTPKIMFKHMLPNIISPMIVSTTMQVGGTIMSVSALAYIGLGVTPPTPEWGAMLSESRDVILSYPHEMLFPGMAIFIVIICINIFGDGLRDALDPKLKT